MLKAGDLMRIVTSVAECRQLISEKKNRIGRLCTNCFIMTGAFDSTIRENRLFSEEYPEGLCLFADEQRYYQLFYFLDSSPGFPFLRKEKPVLIEEINIRGDRDKEISLIESRIRPAGFQKIRKNCYFSCKLPEAEKMAERYQRQLVAAGREGWTVRKADETSLVSQVITLWESCLDPTDIPISHMRFFHSQQDQVLCATDNEKVIGAVWSRMGRDTCEERHIAVHPDYRRHGVGRLLLESVIASAIRAGGKTVHTWISETNITSVTMHERAGFHVQPRSCNQYILREE